jgi:hypothetical protein
LLRPDIHPLPNKQGWSSYIRRDAMIHHYPQPPTSKRR